MVYKNSQQAVFASVNEAIQTETSIEHRPELLR